MPIFMTAGTRQILRWTALKIISGGPGLVRRVTCVANLALGTCVFFDFGEHAEEVAKPP